MANYCKHCGAKLEEGALFCPACGAKLENGKKTFCPACGAELEQGARFCKTCGARTAEEGSASIVIDAPPGSTVTISDGLPVGAGDAEPHPQSSARSGSANRKGAAPNRSSSVHPQTAGNGESRRAGKGTRLLSFLLAVVMLVELGIAGLKYPGFLRKKDSPGGGPSVSVRPTASPVPTDGIGPQPGSMPDAAADDEEDSPFTEAIRLRYTPEQIDSAPWAEAEVSRQTPDVRVGQVEVQLNSWNLEEDTDTLIVKTLPELSSGEEGWAIRAYDFSLASGQHEFSSEVAITIPRETEGLLGGCVWYNETEDRWEDVYTELSEDGSSYVLYTDHFSVLGEKTYKFDKDLLELVDSDGFTVNLKSGVLVLVPSSKKNSMEWKVGIDWNRLWNQYQKKDEKDIAALGTKLDKLFAPSMEAVDDAARDEMTNQLHDLMGKFGLADSTISGFGDFIEALEDLGLGKTFLIMDIALTNLKIISEMRRGNKDVYAMIQAYPEACWKYKQEIAGLTLSALAAACCANWVAAVVCILWWSGTNIYNKLTDRMLYETKSRPTLEEMYLQYYTGSCYRIDFGSSAVLYPSVRGSEFRYLTMEMGETMDDADLEKIKKAVNRKGLKITTSPTGKSPSFSPGWADALTAILKTCSDDPEYLSQALDNFYFSYAWAFWNMPEDKQEAFIHAAFWLGGEEGEAASLERLRSASAADRLKITNAFVDQLKAGTYEILRDAVAKIQHESCKNLQKEVERQLLPILNTRLVFHVEDTALTGGETLQQSIYGENWRSIPENARFAAEEPGLRFDDPSLITPMRFGGNPHPLFLPLIPRDTRDPSKDSYNKLEWYYPYTPEFLPEVPASGDVVYRCTYYHYLMMGAPDTMLFKETEDRENYPYNLWVPADIKLPKMTGQKKADITIKVEGGKRQERRAVICEGLELKRDALLEPDYSYPGGSFSELLHEANPAAGSVSISKEGVVTITVSATELSDSYYSSYYEENVERSASRGGFTVRGRITEESGYEISGILTEVPDSIRVEQKWYGYDDKGSYAYKGLRELTKINPTQSRFRIELEGGEPSIVHINLYGTVANTHSSGNDYTENTSETGDFKFVLMMPGASTLESFY